MIDQVQSDNIGKIFKNFEVVYGQHGSGKSHYIRDCIKKHRENHSTGTNFASYVKILSINETFNKMRFVRRFRNDSLNTFDVLIYLNINLVWPQSKDYQALFDELVDEINWFFFDYFILHYVEVMEYMSRDGSACTSPECLSLVLPEGTSISVYVEAPFWDIPLIQEVMDRRVSIEASNDFSNKSLSTYSRNDSVTSVDEESLKRSLKKFDEIFPVFALLGKKTQPPSLYDVSSSGVQLVCKYLKGYHDKNLDHLMKRDNKIIKIDKIISETMAEIVCGILYGRLRETFYKINIHSAMTAKEVENFFRDVQKHAESLNSYYENFIQHSPELKTLYQKPILTVFLDEINTSCCPGFMKEIIIDGTIDGRSISTSGNIFIVAACNPHRANSLAVVTKSAQKEKKGWFNPTYYVQNLPPTLKLIMWDYGQLQKGDEKEYIKQKFRLEYEDMPQLEYSFLAEQIAKAQDLIRAFACENLILEGVNEEDAKLFAQSTVSQRDIKRVFQLYSYLKKWFTCDTKYGHESEFRISVRAVFISLALVYYFRLSDEIIKSQKAVQPGGEEKKSFRKRFKQIMHEKRTIGECGIPVTFNEALSNELTW
ncbi:PREDICTED: uncharacterized protein LOC109590098, partial [Amphimedon queenslandica]|uniref:ATPase dynein-related AAA domain-containing protein n=2 Tax=Amphimedon queenslandica TaxID=400682 RepID=A0AAN0JXF5_AMPQE